jgi:hypothetical protein
MGMSKHRRRSLLYALVGMAVVWIVALGGYFFAKSSRVTPETVAYYLHSVDLSKLSGEPRAKALRDLANQMKVLPIDERRRARTDGEWARWFAEMSEEEKGAFIEATFPSGFKQMLTSFEQLPEEKRKLAIARAIGDLKKARENPDSPESTRTNWWRGTNGPPELSQDLQQKVVKIGLKSFYSESSAQAKAELAPLLEEMQRTMESGALFRRR